jgi:hypothetical protein
MSWGSDVAVLTAGAVCVVVGLAAVLDVGGLTRRYARAKVHVVADSLPRGKRFGFLMSRGRALGVLAVFVGTMAVIASSVALARLT